jgi:hypothetical protein
MASDLFLVIWKLSYNGNDNIESVGLTNSVIDIAGSFYYISEIFSLNKFSIGLFIISQFKDHRMSIHCLLKIFILWGELIYKYIHNFLLLLL